MRIAEYTGPENIGRPLQGGATIATISSVEEGKAEIKRLFAKDNCAVTGYNEEMDYYWGRGRSPSLQGRRVLRIEP